MAETIYISRRCEYCHELLILLHKNRDILKYKVSIRRQIPADSLARDRLVDDVANIHDFDRVGL